MTGAGSLSDLDIRRILRQFVLETLSAGAKPDRVDDKASFLETGIIDSTGVLELVSFLENEFYFNVADEDLTPDNLDSIEKLVTYIKSKLSSG